jgi:hypothetical protein
MSLDPMARPLGTPGRPETLALVLALTALLAACASMRHEPLPPPPPPPPRGEPLPPEPAPKEEDEPGPVRAVQEPIVVAAWAEPRQLGAGGGQVQIIVRVQKKGGARFPGVEVRLSTSAGSLYSAGKLLVTDAQGMTRDRLTTHKSSVVTLNAGGTRYRFQVPVGEPAP